MSSPSASNWKGNTGKLWCRSRSNVGLSKPFGVGGHSGRDEELLFFGVSNVISIVSMLCI